MPLKLRIQCEVIYSVAALRSLHVEGACRVIRLSTYVLMPSGGTVRPDLALVACRVHEAAGLLH